MYIDTTEHYIYEHKLHTGSHTKCVLHCVYGNHCSHIMQYVTPYMQSIYGYTYTYTSLLILKSISASVLQYFITLYVAMQAYMIVHVYISAHILHHI